jgi:hypothetical protein
MAFTYDLATDVGKVRLMVPDRLAADPIFQDDEITAFLGVEASSLRRAAALALETIASDQVLVLKVIRVQDLTTDGAKVSDALLKRAAQLRAQANDDDAAGGYLFNIAQLNVNDFTEREILYNDWLKTL